MSTPRPEGSHLESIEKILSDVSEQLHRLTGLGAILIIIAMALFATGTAFWGLVALAMLAFVSWKAYQAWFILRMTRELRDSGASDLVFVDGEPVGRMVHGEYLMGIFPV